jgi:hypothetical protein
MLLSCLHYSRTTSPENTTDSKTKSIHATESDSMLIIDACQKSVLLTYHAWSQPAQVQKCVQRKDPNASSFSFGDDGGQPPAMSAHQMRQKKKEFNDNRIGSGLGFGSENRNSTQQQPQNVEIHQGGKAGFGDTGASCVKVQAPPGGRSSGNIIGGWN